MRGWMGWVAGLLLALACSTTTEPGVDLVRHRANLVDTSVTLLPASLASAVNDIDTVVGTVKIGTTTCNTCAVNFKTLGSDSLRLQIVSTFKKAPSQRLNAAVVKSLAAGTARLRGGFGGKADTVVVTIGSPPPPPPGMVLAPDTLRLTVGGASDTLRVTGTTITPSWAWDPAAPNCLVAGFGATQFVTGWRGTAVCTVRVWATAGTEADTSVIIVTNGGGGGSGNVQISTVAQLTAFLTSGVHATRDTGFVARGTYAGQFTVSASNIVVRAKTGEKATIDGKVLVTGHDVAWWGMDGTDSRTSGDEWDGITVRGANFLFINSTIHDQRGNGIEATGTQGPGFQAHGFLLYHNGLKGAGDHVPDVAHGLYVQNDPGTPKVIEGGIIMETQGYGVHAYTEGAQLADLTFQDNIIANNGRQDGCNVMIGGGVPVVRLLFDHNSLSGLLGNGCLWVGRLGPSNGPATVSNNIVLGGDPTLRAFDWASLTAQNNSFVNLNGLPYDFEGQGGITFGGNKWYGPQAYVVPSGDTFNGTSPSGQDVRVAPSQYEPGRANIAVYNWTGAATATANVPGLGSYELRRADDFWGPAVGTGTGPSVTLPVNGAVFAAYVVAPTGTLPR